MRALRGRAAAVFAPREGQRKKHTTRIFPRFFINARLAPAACGTQECFPQAARFHRTACSRRGPPRRPGFTENASGPLRANANQPCSQRYAARLAAGASTHCCRPSFGNFENFSFSRGLGNFRRARFIFLSRFVPYLKTKMNKTGFYARAEQKNCCGNSISRYIIILLCVLFLKCRERGAFSRAVRPVGKAAPDGNEKS